MGRLCTVCGHKDLDEINSLLLCSDSYRDIARQFNLSKDALARHKESHIPEVLLKSTEIKEVTSADNLMTELMTARDRTYSLLDKAEAAADTKLYGAPVAYLREIREQLKLMAELEGKLATQPQITIINSPEWVALRTCIITALDPFPQAKGAVIDAIRGR